MFHANLVVLGGRIWHVTTPKISQTGQPLVWLRVVSTPRKNPAHYNDPFDQWVMVLGRTAMMVSDNWARGRTVHVQGVLRNTSKKVAESQPNRSLPLTYVKAIQVSFGDDRPSQRELLQRREEDYLPPEWDQDDQNAP